MFDKKYFYLSIYFLIIIILITNTKLFLSYYWLIIFNLCFTYTNLISNFKFSKLIIYI